MDWLSRYLPGQCKILEPDHDGRSFSKHRQVSRTLHSHQSGCASPPVPGMPCLSVAHSEHYAECCQLHVLSSQGVSTMDTTPQKFYRPIQEVPYRKVTLWREMYIVLLPHAARVPNTHTHTIPTDTLHLNHFTSWLWELGRLFQIFMKSLWTSSNTRLTFRPPPTIGNGERRAYIGSREFL